VGREEAGGGIGSKKLRVQKINTLTKISDSEMKKKITSIKYSKDKRAHIPSMEEAGYEDANEKVAEGIKELALPTILWCIVGKILNYPG
jgi:hypothetical protein